MAKTTTEMMERCCPFKTYDLEWLTSFWNQCRNVCTKTTKITSLPIKANTWCIKALRIEAINRLEILLYVKII